MPSKFAFQLINSLTRLIRAKGEVKIASPEESGRIESRKRAFQFQWKLRKKELKACR